MPYLLNKHIDRWRDGAVDIMRPGRFGNPFVIGQDGDRDEVCDKFERWIMEPEQATLLEEGKKIMRGKDLYCCCAPMRCHGDTWLRIANEEERNVEQEAPKSPLRAALAKAQEKAQVVIKAGKSRYGMCASAEMILAVVKEANEGLGLSYRGKKSPLIRNAAGELVALNRVIVLAHESGEEVECEMEWPLERIKNKDGKETRTEEDSVATALTRSLGYLLRDAYGLPRLKQEDFDAEEGKREESSASTLEMTLAECTALAKALIQAERKTKESLVSGVRDLVGDKGAVGDDGRWGDLDEAKAGKILAYLKLVTEKHEKEPQVPRAATTPTPDPAVLAGQDDMATLTKCAKTMLEAGWQKPDLIAKIRELTGRKDSIGDDGRWGQIYLKEVTSLLSSLGKICDSPPSKARPQRPAATSAPASPAPSVQTASASSSEKPASSAASTPSPSDAPSVNDRLVKFAGFVGQAITQYGISRGSMIELLRNWAGDKAVVGDDGRFSTNATARDYANLVQGFKGWEQKLLEEAKKPKDVKKEQAEKAMADADQAMAEWTKLEEASKGAAKSDAPVGF